MYQTILLCTDGSPSADVATDAAIWLAHKLNARIEALYVTDIRLLEGPWLADLGGALGAQPYAALVPQLEEIQKQKADTILTAVRKKCDALSVPCNLAHETGALASLMLHYETRTDLVVLGQRGEHAQWTGEMLGSSVERLIRASIKPTLVTPSAFRPIQRILIATDGSPGADKALHAGLELASLLHAEIILLTVCLRDTEEAAGRVLRDAQEEAETRGIKPRIQLVHGEPEIEILRWAAETRADLIVMGAYGHSRLREFVLGSITHQVIRQAEAPVLLARG